jgi:hypothetical protein
MQTMSRAVEVHVRNQYDIRDWLCKQPVRLDAESVTTVHERLQPVATTATFAPPDYAFGSSTTTGI